jgi:hypothetical protein
MPSHSRWEKQLCLMFPPSPKVFRRPQRRRSSLTAFAPLTRAALSRDCAPAELTQVSAGDTRAAERGAWLSTRPGRSPGHRRERCGDVSPRRPSSYPLLSKPASGSQEERITILRLALSHKGVLPASAAHYSLDVPTSTAASAPSNQPFRRSEMQADTAVDDGEGVYL